jgi:hypothetical protein
MMHSDALTTASWLIKGLKGRGITSLSRRARDPRDGGRPRPFGRGTSANQVPGADISLLLGGPVAPLGSTTVSGSATL